jgi:hypothetical protein
MRPSLYQKPIHTGVSCERHPWLPAEGLVRLTQTVKTLPAVR